MRGRRSNESPVSLFSLQDIITCLTGVMILLVLMLALETVTRSTVMEVQTAPDTAALKESIEQLETRQEELRRDLQARELAIASAQVRTPLEAARELQMTRREVEVLKRRLADLDVEKQDLDAELARLSSASEPRSTKLEEIKRKLAQAETEAAQRAFRPIAFIPEAGTSKTAHLVECGSNTVRLISLAMPRRDVAWKATEARTAFVALLTSCSPSREYFVFMLKPSGVPIGMDLYFTAKRGTFEAGYDALEEDAGVSPGGGT
jgi:hypothetical protein